MVIEIVTETVVIVIETGTGMDVVVTGIETVTGMAVGMIVTDVTYRTIGIAMPITFDVTTTTDSAMAGTAAGTPTTGISVAGTSTPIVRDQATGGLGVRPID